MIKNEIYTIELNLDDDFANSCAYHVDSFSRTITRNILAAEDAKKTQRWVLIGLAPSWKEAIEKSYEIQKLLCERNKRKSYGIAELIHD